MRFLCLALLALFLLGFNARAFSCEHTSDTTEAIVVQKSHNFHIRKTVGVSPLEKSIGSCCSSFGMTCCLTVTNAINIVQPSYRVSEEIFLQADNYKSFVSYTLQRPPCNLVV